MDDSSHPPVVATDCLVCGGTATLDLHRKAWADDGDQRTYIAFCNTCGTVGIREPLKRADGVVCSRCAGRLTWASELDTTYPLDAFPLVCSQCSAAADGGVRFGTKRQQRLVARLHALDRKRDALWLRAGFHPAEDWKYHRAADARAEHLNGRRRALNFRLADLTRTDHVEQVKAETLER